jgi:hypothetical protein
MPKGVTDARKEKGSSNGDVEVKKRRAHDPNRGLESLPAARYFTNEKFSLSKFQNAKNLLTILYTMSNTRSNFRPTVNNVSDLSNWGRELNVDEGGFVIVRLTGATGTASCISRGSMNGKVFHITSGGKTYSNKRGTHIYLCGTTNANSAHIVVDLSDQSVNCILPILENMKIVNLSEEKTEKKDDDIEFVEAELKGAAYVILIEAAKLINPKVSFKMPKSMTMVYKEEATKKKKIVETSYLDGMDLPSYDAEENTVQKAKKAMNNSITDWNENNDEDEEDEEDDDTPF